MEQQKVIFLNRLQEVGRFEKLEDGWVKDNLLGLDWGPSSNKLMDWEEAKKFCADKGGRLPEIQELQTIVDYSNYKPAINTEFFPDTKIDDWYWTGTTVARWSVSAWVVPFNHGYVYNYGKDGGFHVRPVRPSIN